MASNAAHATGTGKFGATNRSDAWWVAPLATGLGLAAFVVYATFRAIYNADYVVDNAVSAYLLSPFSKQLMALIL